MPEAPPPPTGSSPVANAATSHHALTSAVRSTALMTLASRLFGLVRDVLIGRIFGDSALNSAFQFAFAIPNMFRRLFGEGALSAAFIPQYTQSHKFDPAQANQLASLTMIVLAAVTAVITIVVELVLFAILIFGDHSPDRRLLIELVMTMLPFMPLICMVAILAGMLQVHGRFAAAASGPLVLNAFIIAIGLYSISTGWRADARIAFALGIATVLSAATQLWWFNRLLRSHVTWTRDCAPARQRARAMFGKFVPVAIGLGTLQLNTFLDNTIATFPIWFDTEAKGIPFPLDEKSNAILALTSRLYQFPLGVFGIAVASAAFPLLARHADEPGKFTETLRRGLRLSLFIGLPASLGLILVRHDLTAVLFGSGENSFTERGLERSAAVLLGFAPGVWAYSLNHVFTRAFYAKGNTRTPMMISIAAMLFNIALNLTLIWKLKEAGMAWATSTAAILQCVVLATLARRHLCPTTIFDRETTRAFGRIVLASLFMALCVWGAQMWIPMPFHNPWVSQFASLACATIVGMVVFVTLCRVFGIRELRWLLSRMPD